MQKTVTLALAMMLVVLTGAVASDSEQAGALAGAVTDRDARPLADVRVTATSRALSMAVETRTGDDGVYRLQGLPGANDWVIGVSSGARFAPMWQDRVVVRAARTTRESFALFGSIHENIEVVADGGPLVDLREVGQRTVYSGDFIRGLPLTCGF